MEKLPMTAAGYSVLEAELKHRFEGGILLRNQFQYNNVKTDARETAPQGIGTIGVKPVLAKAK